MRIKIPAQSYERNEEITCVAFLTQPKVVSDNNQLSHDANARAADVSHSEKDVARAAATDDALWRGPKLN